MYAFKGTVPPEEIPEADENLASSLWREVRKKVEEDRSGRASSLWREVRKKVEEDRSGRASPPFPFMEENHPLRTSGQLIL